MKCEAHYQYCLRVNAGFWLLFIFITYQLNRYMTHEKVKIDEFLPIMKSIRLIIINL